MQLDDVHGGHRQPRPIYQAGDVAVQLDVRQAGVAGPYLSRIFLGEIPQFQQVLVPEHGVVVEGNFGVECDQLAGFGDNQRVDLHQAAVVLHISPTEGLHELLRAADGRSFDPQLLAELADLIAVQAGVRVEMFLENLLRRLGRDFLDFHATLATDHQHRLGGCPVEDDA